MNMENGLKIVLIVFLSVLILLIFVFGLVCIAKFASNPAEPSSATHYIVTDCKTGSEYEICVEAVEDSETEIDITRSEDND